MDTDEAARECAVVTDAVRSGVTADRTVVERVLLGVLAGGHVLLEGVPGTGETLTTRSFATALGLSFSRVPFVTPDDVKDVADPFSATGIVLTADAKVEDALGSVTVPTVRGGTRLAERG